VRAYSNGKLATPVPNNAITSLLGASYSPVIEPLSTLLLDQRCLTTLKPRLDFAMLPLTLVTSSRRLAMSRRRTASDTFSLLNSALNVGETGKDGRLSGILERETSERGRQLAQGSRGRRNATAS
jgi:hypothetical protein